MTHRVVVLARHGVIPFELSIPARIFGAARTADGRQLYDVRTCGLAAGTVRTDADFDVVVPHGPEALTGADTVVIPASYETTSVSRDGRLPAELAAAFERIEQKTRLVSICTGAFALAAAGRLDGRPATTHWRSTGRFAELFPQVKLDPDVLFVDDGDILTSAGVAAGIDLCLHIVRRDFGTAVANRAARRCLVPPWRDGGQAQYVDQPVPEAAAPTTAGARTWALARLDQPLTLDDLASQQAMSVRTFTRRFRQENGVSPGQWLIQQRVDRARHLLEDSDLTVDEVARRCGFGTTASMRQHLRASLGVSPSGYRRTFRS
ncbi:GlxA family transcriptional regulator [Jiangella alkaliphila]|uniref:Transcriptional regulator GlxA family, contains an amidase domain and an AraC-type DNA-binding HTH domain n=1 Tax=Jiangella alkaliphila TaxID=419479 RepID=A0A1H2L745_9ACTN|nr:helix-turn-helix domain-containing protein [Jiangella alkaliphila]SDU76266.1 Transcriptional regulator GlxA family, contains an amidase domain and an AraC-type DNA-binding HTH domain [Jiangella alkaliphila]